MADAWAPLIILILVALNGLFVAAEFAIVSVPRPTVEALAARGHRTARQIEAILRDPRQQDRFIATAQVGITVASLGLGMYGEHVLAGIFTRWLGLSGLGGWLAAHGAASILAVALLTYLHIVLGEMIPKTLALQRPQRIALGVVPVLLTLQRLLAPVIGGLNAIGNGLLRLIGVRRQSGGLDQVHSAAELELIIEESQAGGLLPASAGEVLQELFDFGQLTAADVMVPRVEVVGLPLGRAPADLLDLVRMGRHNRYPVYEGDLDHIVGMVHVKDLLRLSLAGDRLTAQTIRPIQFIAQTARLDTVLAIMRQTRTQIAVVMDEHGGTAGLVTIEDLCEEVSGEIDEGDGRPEPLWQDETGRWHAMGTVRLDDLDEVCGTQLASDLVDTVSGLVLMHLNRPAAVGDAITVGETRLVVVAVEGRGVRECLVEPSAAA